MDKRRLSRWVVWLGAVVLALAVGPGALRGEVGKPERPDAEAPTTGDAKTGGKAKAKGKAAGDKTRREIQVDAGHWQYDNKRMLHVLTPSDKVKHVTIREIGEDYEMVADRVEYDDRNDTATGTENLTFSDPDTTIVGDLIVVNFDQKLATVTGDVKLTSHGEESEDEDDDDLPLKERYRKKKTVIDCDQIDYWYKEKRAEAHGNLRFRQGDRHGTAGKAVYFEKDDVLLLEGEVNVTNKKGETAKAPTVTIDNKEDTMVADQGVTITFFVDEEEEGESGEGTGKSSGKAEGKPEAKESDEGGGKGKEEGETKAPGEEKPEAPPDPAPEQGGKGTEDAPKKEAPE